MSLNDILEWQAIVALRSYLIFTLLVANEEFDPNALDEATISSANAKENFEFELTRVFVRPDPLLEVGVEKVEHCRPKLVKLVTLLDSLAGIHRLWPAASPPRQGEESRFHHIFGCTEYKRLWILLEHLETTGVPLNLIKGTLGPAFDVPVSDKIADGLKVVQDVNFLFDSLPLSKRGVAASEDLISDVAARAPGDSIQEHAVTTRALEDSIQKYAAATFNAMFSQLKGCNIAHRVMLCLQSQQDDSLEAPTAFLGLFVSSCAPRRGWQEIQCSERKGLDCGPHKVENLCQVVKGTNTQGLVMRVAGQELHNITQVPPHTRHPYNFPKMSLHSLLSRGAFKPLDLDHLVLNRFSRSEKRKLAMDIASSLSRLLGSGWVGSGWCSKDLYFLEKVDKAARSNKLLGPYIVCAAGGPPLADLECWQPGLGEPPVFFLLAKLLLEIDLGEDLGGRIEDALKENPDDDLQSILLDIREESKYDLDFDEAIASCLEYPLMRIVKLELGEFTETPGQWTEWDRGYIREVAKKLAGPAAVNDQGCDSGGTGPTESVAPFGQSRSDLTCATTADLEQRAQSPSIDLTADTCHSILTHAHEISPEAAPHMPQPAGNVSLCLSRRLEGADLSVVAPENPLASRQVPKPGMMGEDEVDVIFDATESRVFHEHLRDGAKSADNYWVFMRDFNKRHFPPPPGDALTDRTDAATRSRRIKIALIDTGVDIEDAFIKPEYESGRITGRSWVREETDFSDSCGHGTHLVRLVLKVNKSADILVAKVSEGKSFSPRNTQNIVEAIQWAVQQDADIISLSLGFEREVKLISEVLDEVINPKRKTAGVRPRLVFAAAANWGLNRPLAFPASKRGVICVHATYGNGYDGQLGPRADKSLKNFPIGTLGITIESSWKGKPVLLKGTSYATPIAAAVAANVLELSRRHLDAEIQSELERFRGMKAALALMCKDGNSSSYRYCAPWVLYEKMVNGERIRTTTQILEAITHEVDDLNY